MLKKILLLSSMVLICTLGSAKNSPPFFQKIFKKKTTAVVDTVKTETDYEKLFKEKHTTSKGLITLHQIKNDLYFEFPISLLNSEMLIGSTVSEISNNANAIIGSKPLAPLHVKFTKEGMNVQLRKISHQYLTDNNDSGLTDALKKSTIGAIMRNMKIDAYSPDSSAIIFKMTDFFLEDNKQMSPFDQQSLYSMAGYKRSESFQKDKSFLGEVKSFEDNITIKSHLSYTYTLTTADGKEAAKDVPFTAILTRSIILLKDKQYRPRYGDYRMAIFPTHKYVLEEKDQGIWSTYFSNRWDLEPDDKDAYARGEKVNPVKPIVFYIDNTFPEKWRKYIKEGVEQWNEVFEEIGFKNAVLAKDFPKNDSIFDPDNLKNSCIRYAPIGIANAMGPSWTDPRTGEIIAASVYLYHNVIELLNNWIFIQTSQTVEEVRTKNIPDSIIGDGLRYVVAHEIGHCLGLMHNMSGSSVIPVDSLRSPSFTQKYGTTTSIMDYARFNYVAQPGDYQKGVKMTPPRFGEYDRFSIKWLYTYFPNTTFEEESAKLSQWKTERSGDPLYHYGKQQIYQTIDPRSQVEDLGDNAMKASAYGIKNLEYITGKLNKWLDDDDDDYNYRKKIYNGIINQYLRYIGHVYANVGGVYLQEIKRGDEGQIYETVPKEIQKEALNYLMDQVNNHDWFDNQELRGKLGIAPSVNDVIDSYLVKMIISSPAKVVLSSTLTDNDPYGFKECADDVFRFVWKSTISGKRPSDNERMMQREFVDIFMINAQLMDPPKPGGTAFSEPMIGSYVAIDNAPTCSHTGCLNNTPQNLSHTKREGGSVWGYEWSPEFRLFAPMSHASDSFSYVQLVKNLLKRSIQTSTGTTRAHYELLLQKIENNLNNNRIQ
jgi:hypothetical protein